MTKEDREWSKLVRDRDNNKCVVCERAEKLNAHHIIPKENKETRHALINGISLCPLHHRFSRTLSAHQHPLAFFKWMEKHRSYQLACMKDKCNI